MAELFFENKLPFSSAFYTEAGSGQYFVSSDAAKRASFADATARHKMEYSRFHKSKYFCASCHDVSNPVLANMLLAEAGVANLPSESTGGFLVLPCRADLLRVHALSLRASRAGRLGLDLLLLKTLQPPLAE
jgi:hypothetical protein